MHNHRFISDANDDNGNKKNMHGIVIKVMNERVRALTRQEQLLTKIGEHRLRWWGHVQRMEDEIRAKLALNWIPERSRKIGRPGITWNDNMTPRIVESHGKRPFL